MIKEHLQKTEIATIIPEIVEYALPGGVADKVLTVGIILFAKPKGMFPSITRRFSLFFYRPKNQTFVGLYEGDLPNDYKNLQLKCLMFNDSSWKDEGVKAMVNEMFENISKKILEIEKNISGCEVYSDFGLISPGIVDGKIEINTSSKMALFNSLSK